MAIEHAIRAQLAKLISDGASLAPGGNEAGQVRDENHRSECVGWLAAAEHLVTLICKNSTDVYQAQISKLARRPSGYMVNASVGSTTAILQRLSDDIDHGLLTTLSNTIIAEAFDNFLDHAEEYRKKGRKQEAGVIAGVVFEDTIRRICRDRGLIDKGKRLEDLINDLVKNGTITSQQSRQAKVASHVRTKATHAQWDEFDLEGVSATIQITQRLLQDHLGG
jgi:hypothetical protein